MLLFKNLIFDFQSLNTFHEFEFKIKLHPLILNGFTTIGYLIKANFLVN